MSIRILFDVDDVHAQCIKAMLVDVNAYLSSNYTEHDLIEHWDLFTNINASKDLIDHVSARMRSEGWCANLEPFPGAVEAVERVRSLTMHPFFVTAPFDGPYWVTERLGWLKRHLGVDRKHVVQTHSKFLVTGEVFVDDNPGHVRDWKAAHPHGFAVLWGRPWNAKNTDDLHRIESWEQFFEDIPLIKRIVEAP